MKNINVRVRVIAVTEWERDDYEIDYLSSREGKIRQANFANNRVVLSSSNDYKVCEAVGAVFAKNYYRLAA